MPDQHPLTDELDRKISNCERGQHDFEEIHRVDLDNPVGEERILQWCKVCGTIREKTEYDGRFPRQNWCKIPEATEKLKSPQ